MRYYQSLQPIKAISFDLDDTLYDNGPVIDLAEQKFLETLQRESKLAQLDQAIWLSYKKNVASRSTLISEDVIQWRIETIRHLLQQHHFSSQSIESIIESSMAEFDHWRHQIYVPQTSIDLLNTLAKYYPLIAITNGNVVPERIGLSQFSLYLRGGEHGRAKPHTALFKSAVQFFNIEPQQLLHIGDHLTTDVYGARQAGCQVVWLNSRAIPINQHSECRLLPTVEINQITELQKLLPNRKFNLCLFQ